MRNMSLSWLAVRKGKVYCSEACGNRCTWAEYQKASKRAKALTKELNKKSKAFSGELWKGEVWENLGWHNVATVGKQRFVAPSALVSHRGKSYEATVYVQSSLSMTASGRTPSEAVRNAMKKAHAVITDMRNKFQELSDMIS